MYLITAINGESKILISLWRSEDLNTDAKKNINESICELNG